MTDKNVEHKEIASEHIKADAPRRSTTMVWISALCALLAWVCLIWLNGYVALGLGIAGLILGFITTLRCEGSQRRLAITAVVASAIVVVVLLSFMMVIWIALGS